MKVLRVNFPVLFLLIKTFYAQEHIRLELEAEQKQIYGFGMNMFAVSMCLKYMMRISIY